MMRVLQPGFQTSVQDLGRYGLRRLGVGQSGAMDPLALRIVNALLGNRPQAAALEVTLGHFAVQALATMEVAIGGGEAAATVDGLPLPNWWVCVLRPGQILRLGAQRSGMRTYIGVRGGIDVAPVLGSRSTDLKGGFGGFAGRALCAGDELRASCTQTTAHPGYGLSVRRLDPYPELASDTPALPVLAAAQWDEFPQHAQALLLQSAWRLSAQSNRVGCRLEGPPLERRERHDLNSHGILPGVIQVPPSGLPAVQLCDGNTAGGYPVIAVVAACSLHLFGQLRPGQTLRFALASPQEAAERRASQAKLLAQVAEAAAWGRRRHGLPSENAT